MSFTAMSSVHLAGDVGGTKTLLRLLDAEGQALRQSRYESAKYPGLDAIVSAFRDECASASLPAPVVGAFGVAGPVVDGRCKTTNLPWELEEKALAAACKLARVRILNDFEATAYGVIGLPPESLATLQEGTAAPHGVIGVIGAGTGLGEALLVPLDHGDARVVASEGGHSDFAPSDDRQIDLLRHLRERFGGHVSFERVVSGMGIVNVYEFLRDTGVFPEAREVATEMKTKDRGAVIGTHALAKSDALCLATIDLFIACYGAEAGNLALKGLTSGGIYLTGGIAPKLLAKLKEGAFLQAFRDKGRLSRVVAAAPVHVVLDQEVPLRGAAWMARRMARATSL